MEGRNDVLYYLSWVMVVGGSIEGEDLSGGLRRNRTTDTKIFSLLLYRLSYQALKLKAGFYIINLKIKLKVVIISPKT